MQGRVNQKLNREDYCWSGLFLNRLRLQRRRKSRQISQRNEERSVRSQRRAVRGESERQTQTRRLCLLEQLLSVIHSESTLRWMPG